MQRKTRRSFLAHAGAGAAFAGGRTFSATNPAGDKVILALIGAGGRGQSLIKGMTSLRGVEVKYVCDCDRRRGGGIAGYIHNKQGYAPKRVSDMRTVFDDKKVDAVVVATPEHWHALASVWACRAGKDVYVEKCPTLTIWEGRKMIEAAEKYNRVVQIGTQNRSAPYNHAAREYIKSGKLGKVIHVKVFNMLGGGPWKPVPNIPTPEGLDWDKWLGPASFVPYNPGRHHTGGNRGWGNWWAYSGCPLSDDGSHNLDLARLALNDPPHPKAVYAAGGRIAFKDKRETPDMLAATYDFGDFTMTCECTQFAPYMKKSGGDVRFHDKFPYWPQNSTRVEIYGTRRMMYLGRHGGGWQVYEGNAAVVDHAYGRFPDQPHQRNFIECVRSRKKPHGDVTNGHFSATLVHLANLALRTGGRRLLFDGTEERFTNCEEANELLKPRYREPYRIPDEV